LIKEGIKDTDVFKAEGRFVLNILIIDIIVRILIALKAAYRWVYFK
jgi:hypothetical protein